jgi:hypothetical protein
MLVSELREYVLDSANSGPWFDPSSESGLGGFHEGSPIYGFSHYLGCSRFVEIVS